MGLDAYVWIAKPNLESYPDTLSYEQLYYEDGTRIYENKYKHENLYYWRRNGVLNRYMEELYYSKGGTGDFDFNNTAVKLDVDDLARLAKRSILGYLYPWPPKECLDFIAMALEELDNGSELYYEPCE